MFVHCSTQSPSYCEMGRLNFNFDSLLCINRASVIWMFLPNSIHVYCLTWHHTSSIANTRQHSDSIKPCNLFVCLRQNPANFIKARPAKCVTADLVLRHASLLSRVLSSSRFSRAEKPRCPVCIPFQLSQHHLIPITLIIAARDVSERGERETEA